MTNLIILRHLEIQNANAISGLTAGFPAITHFLGFVHKLSRLLGISHSISLGATAIVAHEHQIQSHKTDPYWGDRIFALTRNPLNQDGTTAAINEEGRMHLRCSLLIQCFGAPAGNTDKMQALCNDIKTQVLRMRCAGGQVIGLRKVDIVESPKIAEDSAAALSVILRRLLPGFLLIDRSTYLKSYHQQKLSDLGESELLDSFLDFCSLRRRATNLQNTSSDSEPGVEWETVPKPRKGYLVPVMIGYKAISKMYGPGEVLGSRDPELPFSFVEPLHSIAEWKSPHTLHRFDEIFWEYAYKDGYYLCRSPANATDQSLSIESTALPYE